MGTLHGHLYSVKRLCYWKWLKTGSAIPKWRNSSSNFLHKATKIMKDILMKCSDVRSNMKSVTTNYCMQTCLLLTYVYLFKDFRLITTVISIQRERKMQVKLGTSMDMNFRTWHHILPLFILHIVIYKLIFQHKVLLLTTPFCLNMR